MTPETQSTRRGAERDRGEQRGTEEKSRSLTLDKQSSESSEWSLYGAEMTTHPQNPLHGLTQHDFEFGLETGPLSIKDHLGNFSSCRNGKTFTSVKIQ